MGGTEEQSGVAQLRAACWEVVGKGGLAPVFPSRPGTLLVGSLKHLDWLLTTTGPLVQGTLMVL